MKPLTWDDAEGIGIALHKAYPEIDPLKARFTEIHQRVTALPDFQDDPFASTEAQLEAIQGALHEEWQAGLEKPGN